MPRRQLSPLALVTIGTTTFGALSTAVAACSMTFTAPGTPILSDASNEDAGDGGPSGTGPDGSSGKPPSVDSGNDGPAVTPLDSGGGNYPDSSGPTTPDASAPSYVTFVNASADLTNLGLCQGIVESVNTFDTFIGPPMALTAGTAFGTPWSYDGASLSKKNVALFAIDLTEAPSLATTDCSAIVSAAVGVDGGISVTYNTVMWELGPIASGKIPAGSGAVIAIVGCEPNDTTNAPKCGTGYSALSGVSNLAANVTTLDSTTVIDGGVGVQFLQSSAAWDYAVQSATGVGTSAQLGTVGDGGPPGNATSLTTNTHFGDLSPATAIGVDSIASLSLFASGIPSGGGQPVVFDGGPLVAAFPVSPAIETMTWGQQGDGGPPATPSGTFANGTNWTFVLVGDPSISAKAGPGEFNPAGAHFVIAPSALP